MQPVSIQSPWAAQVNPDHPLPEYPRPQMVRSQWQNLNGLWDYAITAWDAAPPSSYQEKILVPFPIESALSGVQKTLLPKQRLWYHTSFTIQTPPTKQSTLSSHSSRTTQSMLSPPSTKTTNTDYTNFSHSTHATDLTYSTQASLPAKANYSPHSTPIDIDTRQRTLLHFGAVDWKATVYLNGHLLGSHLGGYHHFTYDITSFLQPGQNDLVVSVYDPTSQGNNPHGKQSLYPRKILYTACSGIWQTVWLETVPNTYITGFTLTPDLDAEELKIKVNVASSYDQQSTQYNSASDDSRYTIQAISTNFISASTSSDSLTLHIPAPHSWRPGDPYLYPLTIRLLQNGIIVDSIASYFAMRKISLEQDANGHPRIFLNHQYTFNLGVLDQGYWPDGIYTAPTDSALAYDINIIKKMGFNTIRKHIKIEPDRWYYYCDKLGMLVWQDLIPPAGHSAADATAFEDESPQLIQQLYNFPSIIVWTLFNEGWGAYDQLRLATQLKHKDPYHLLNAHSGANMDQYSEGDPGVMWAGSDFVDVHKYPGPSIGPALPQKAAVLGEWGGLGVNIEGHRWDPAQSYSYLDITRTAFPEYYQALMELLYLYEKAGLSGAIYTQPFDVEREENGLITYDRKVAKIPVPIIRAINDSLLAATASFK